MNRSRYNKLAEAAYDRVADGSDHFDIGDVISEIVRELSAEDATQELLREFAQSLAAYDRDRKQVAELLVYMPDEDTSLEQAVTEYKATHPPLT